MILIILFYYAASAKGAENEPWLVPAIANVKHKESWNMQLERLYQSLWLFFPLRLHLGYSVALLAIAWWDPWWSLHEKLVLPAPDVLLDLSTFPWGQSSRSTMDWSQGRTCPPNPGQLGYVTLWQERDGPGMEEEGALGGPDHQTTCAQIYQIPHTHRRKWNPCPGQQHQRRRQRASSWSRGWWVHPPCLDEVLWCCVPLSSCKLPILPKQLLAILSWPYWRVSCLFHPIPLHFGKGSYEASSLSLAGNHSSQTGKCDFPLSAVPPCFNCSPTHFNLGFLG